MDKYLLEKCKESSRILIVDDEGSVRLVLRKWLDMEGYNQVAEATSGAEALELLGRSPFDVVLLDKNMPGLDGLEVLKRGRELRADCQFIIMTAYGSLESAMLAIDLGAFGYITKPFPSIGIVTSRVERALEKSALIKYNKKLINRLTLVVNRLKVIQDEPDAHTRTDQVRDVILKILEIINELQTIQKGNDDSTAGQ